MTVLAQEIITSAQVGRMLSDREVSRFQPAEIREAIQALVTEGKDGLAIALGDAGLSLYPDSEDILAITGLLALMRQEWALSVELMEQLRAVQGDKTPPFTYVMLVRALRCNLDPVRALEVAHEGLKQYPDQIELAAEADTLKDFQCLPRPMQRLSINPSTQAASFCKVWQVIATQLQQGATTSTLIRPN